MLKIMLDIIIFLLYLSTTVLFYQYLTIILILFLNIFRFIFYKYIKKTIRFISIHFNLFIYEWFIINLLIIRL